MSKCFFFVNKPFRFACLLHGPALFHIGYKHKSIIQIIDCQCKGVGKMTNVSSCPNTRLTKRIVRKHNSLKKDLITYRDNVFSFQVLCKDTASRQHEGTKIRNTHTYKRSVIKRGSPKSNTEHTTSCTQIDLGSNVNVAY